MHPSEPPGNPQPTPIEFPLISEWVRVKFRSTPLVKSLFG